MTARRLSPARILSVLVLLALVTISTGMLVAGDHSGPPAMQTIAVAPGDTLWELAVRHGSPDEDVRKTVDLIFRANHLTSTRLVVGQRLLVPAPP